jgi:hypothetical protein
MSSLSTNQSAAVSTGLVADLFRRHGWQVDFEVAEGPFLPDFRARKGALQYAVEIKAVAEGRPDRVLALLAQAILQARRHARRGALRPLAVVHVGHASASLAQKVQQFHVDYAPDVAVGLVSEAGFSRFIGDPHLKALDAEIPHSAGRKKAVSPHQAWDLFSDLNQWMLKVLLAPEIPRKLLTAPRGKYRTGSELAEAAQVSAMSASRFVRRLQEEGFLDNSQPSLQLVRRRELFRRWQSAAMQSSPELRMSYLVPGAAERQLDKAILRLDGCIGLFAAADRLNVGYVSGVAPYIYVRRMHAASKDWPGLVPARPGEPAQVIVKRANAPQSLFRGAVRVKEIPVSDVLQIWLDASAHPSRGAEQAKLLEQKVLTDILGEPD